jgi:hypothetical protein
MRFAERWRDTFSCEIDDALRGLACILLVLGEAQPLVLDEYCRWGESFAVEPQPVVEAEARLISGETGAR